MLPSRSFALSVYGFNIGTHTYNYEVLMNNKNAEECYMILKDKIATATDHHIPRKRIRPTNNPSWFSQEIKRLINARQLSYRRLKQYQTEPHRQEHIHTCRAVKRTIKSTKRNKEITVAAQAKTNPKSFYKYLSSIDDHSQPRVLRLSAQQFGLSHHSVSSNSIRASSLSLTDLTLLWKPTFFPVIATHTFPYPSPHDEGGVTQSLTSLAAEMKENIESESRVFECLSVTCTPLRSERQDVGEMGPDDCEVSGGITDGREVGGESSFKRMSRLESISLIMLMLLAATLSSFVNENQAGLSALKSRIMMLRYSVRGVEVENDSPSKQAVKSTTTAGRVNESTSVLPYDYLTVTLNENETLDSQKDSAGDFRSSVNSDVNGPAKDNPHTQVCKSQNINRKLERTASLSTPTLESVGPWGPKPECQSFTTRTALNLNLRQLVLDCTTKQNERNSTQKTQNIGMGKQGRSRKSRLADGGAESASTISTQPDDPAPHCSESSQSEYGTDIMAAEAAVPLHLPLSPIGGLGITEENSQPADPIPVKIPSRNFKNCRCITN
ncbi:hypothetical protein FHG87_010598 [Trinorchestia longiramus]|nr:hypothetical protein FHG87_010598 [Trinorchestia longiramus]